MINIGGIYMKKKLKDLSITTKIISIILCTLLFSEIIISITSYTNMNNLGNYSKNIISDLGTYSSNSSENALKQQSEVYLEKLSKSSSDISNEILKNVSKQVRTVSLSLESIYQNKNNFKGSLPPLPDMVVNNSETDKVYAIDPENISEDRTLALSYDPGEYHLEPSNNIYRTNINDWESLSDNERKEIQNSKVVVSNNIMPQDIKTQIFLLSNIAYTIMPIYKSNSAISSAYIATESGIFYKYSDESSTIRFDPRERPWYKNATSSIKKDGKYVPIWESPYIDKQKGVLCITCSQAFCDSYGNILGVVAFDMYLSDISKYILYHNNKNSGYTFLLDKNGNIVMHPEYSLENHENNFDNTPLEGNIDETYRNVLLNMKNGKNGIEKAKIQGIDYYIAYSPMEETGWSFGIVTKTDEIIQASLQTKSIIDTESSKSQEIINSQVNYLLLYLILIFIICCIFSLIVSISLSYKVIKPIKQLKNGAKKIGEGNLAIKLDVSSQDEIGDLATSFNNMSQNLQKYITNLAETTAEKQKIQSELSIAKKIQLSMLPCIFPAFPDREDFDIYAITDPAKEVGGDFYDFFFIDNEHLGIVIADVSEKGISAALFMVVSKILIKNQLILCGSPDETLEIVNNQLYENNDADMFVTAFIGIYNISTGEFEFSNAGHIPPLLYRQGRDNFEYIKMNHGFVLAGVKDVKYEKYKINLSKNDILFMYTDGVTEATNSNCEMFSDDRLKNILNNKEIKNLNIRDMIIAVKSEISEFSKNLQKSDDITIMAFKVFKKFPH